jgi:hypothetical protein
MNNKLAKAIELIPFIGKWKKYSNKYFSLHAEPGCYNSPIVTVDEVNSNDYYQTSNKTQIRDINLNENQQLELLSKFDSYLTSFPFPENKEFKFRYYTNNSMFRILDGTIFYSFLNHFKPKQIIEIGSGYSSALALDTFELVIKEPVSLTFIDPYTDRVDKLLSKEDFLVTEFIREPIQKVKSDIFSKLNENDIIFIDSSHIVKTSGDLNFIFFELLPLLQSGVILHIHDIFFPFEYPIEWIEAGLCYNEAYFLRTFLMNNDKYEILLWNDFIYQNHYSLISDKIKNIDSDRGGSIWLKKK